MASHSDKWSSCVHDVQRKGGAYNPYAVCTTSVGQQCEKKLPFQEAFECGEKKEAATSSGVGAPLTRAGVKK